MCEYFRFTRVLPDRLHTTPRLLRWLAVSARNKPSNTGMVPCALFSASRRKAWIPFFPSS
jgi:hypothetical protein